MQLIVLKILILFGAVCLVDFELRASEADGRGISSALIDCTKINKDSDRLYCFDKLVQQRVSMTVGKVDFVEKLIPVDSELDKVASAEIPKAESLFGKTVASAKKRIEVSVGYQSVDWLEAKIAKIQRNRVKQYTLYLDNKQVWRQIGTKRIRLKVGDFVRISRGMMGSYQLKKPDASLRVRVKRID